ncbi:MAG: M3 family metallopeptidase [Candidatus Babeliales bacterium]
MQIKKYLKVLVVASIIGCGRAKETIESSLRPEVLYGYTTSRDALYAFFPQNVAQLNNRVYKILHEAQSGIDAIVATPDNERTFENTARALDTVVGHFLLQSAGIATLMYVSPNDVLRTAAERADVKLSHAGIDLFGQNKKLYQAFKAYYEGAYKTEQLTASERYLVEETMDDFKRSGLDLPEDKRQEVIKLEKELSELTTRFQKNINTDTSFFTATQEELDGVEQSVIDNLQKTDDGNYKVGVDYPTYFGVMRYATNPETRKRMYQAIFNKAYPANVHLLHEIIAKRDQLAQLLGYPSYAHLNIDSQMAKTPEAAQKFVCSVITKAQQKADREMAILRADLAPSVTLSPDGKMYAWDGAFARAWYKKKHYNLDEREVSEYFPMEQTIDRLLKIYEQFFDITMHQEPLKSLWVDDLILITVRNNKDNQLLGYLILDLHPRANKYSHACHIGICPALQKPDGTRVPALSVVIANFPKSTKEKPSLLTRSDVSTFFHEFGHGMHAILGATPLATQSGTNVKRDFVEMPSQMLEEWLFDKEILKQVSSHYKTGQSLPDNVIDIIIAMKNFDAGSHLIGQANAALFALKCFCPGGCKDTDALERELHAFTHKHTVHDPDSHHQASFGHLTGYGARYYGYLWSQVYALDLFNHIKKFGLTNPQIGTVYAQKVLGKGGSADPMELLIDFLGREPNENAFMQSMGL